MRTFPHYFVHLNRPFACVHLIMDLNLDQGMGLPFVQLYENGTSVQLCRMHDIITFDLQELPISNRQVRRFACYETLLEIKM